MALEQSHAEVQSVPVERIVALENPVSRNAARGKKGLEELLEVSGLPSTRILTDCDPEVTTECLYSALEPTDLLVVLGGDGTVNTSLEPIMDRQCLLLPTRSGNANDLAMSINGRRRPAQIYQDYRQGKIVPSEMSPIAVTIQDGATVATRHAINYASFGFAALASDYINRPWNHPRMQRVFNALPSRMQNAARLPREGYLLGMAAAHTALFEYEVHPSGEFATAADMTFVHSRRMAKLGRFDIEHTDPTIFMAISPETGVVALGLQFAKAMRAKMLGNYMTSLGFHVRNTDENPLYYQVDGEAFQLPDDSEITIGLAGTVRMLASRVSQTA